MISAVHRQAAKNAKNAKGIFMGAQRNETIAAAESITRSARDESLGASWRLGGKSSAAVIALVAVLALTGCGKKPRNVDPPEGTAEVFPRVYPQDPDLPTPQKAPDPSSVLRSKI